MASYSKVVDFLQKNTELMASVKPDKNLSPDLKKELRNDLERFPYREGVYTAPIVLRDNLKIKFSISSQWKVTKQLEKCICEAPILPGKDLKSVNNAYQAISEVVELDRASHGGSVYENVYFKCDDGNWMPLGRKRDEIYKLYEEEYDRIISIGKDETLPIIQSRLTICKKSLEELEQRLKKDYPEDSGADSWQMWIYKNKWLFATEYAEPFPKQQVGFKSIPDFLFPTLDGFIDVLEIKKPNFEVIEEDKSHRGSYKWAKQTNEAIGQVVNYLYEIELNQSSIVKEIEKKNGFKKISVIKPRGIILIGNSAEWKPPQIEALRKLNHSLNSIEVITYADLVRRGKSLINMMTQD